MNVKKNKIKTKKSEEELIKDHINMKTKTLNTYLKKIRDLKNNKEKKEIEKKFIDECVKLMEEKRTSDKQSENLGPKLKEHLKRYGEKYTDKQRAEQFKEIVTNLNFESQDELELLKTAYYNAGTERINKYSTTMYPLLQSNFHEYNFQKLIFYYKDAETQLFNILSHIFIKDHNKIIDPSVYSKIENLFNRIKESNIDNELMIKNVRLLSLIKEKGKKLNNNKIENKANDLLIQVMNNLDNTFPEKPKKYQQKALELNDTNKFKASELFFVQKTKFFENKARKGQLLLLDKFEENLEKANKKLEKAIKNKDDKEIKNCLLNKIEALESYYGAVNFLAFELMNEKRWTSDPSRLELVLLQKKIEIENDYKQMKNVYKNYEFADIFSQGDNIISDVAQESFYNRFQYRTISSSKNESENDKLIRNALKNIDKWNDATKIQAESYNFEISIDHNPKNEYVDKDHFNEIWKKLEDRNDKVSKKSKPNNKK